MAIPGYLIIRGDGQPFIMAAGIMMIIMDGSGSPVTNGRPHGLAGGMGAVIMAGRL
jgi:hypothetical protein